jgi:4'-phosphopantetheinyl transferase EntD
MADDDTDPVERLLPVIERLVPAGVACAETREDRLDVELFESERRSLGRAVGKRRREFATGRGCARLALGRLGVPVVAIPSGPHGEPLWPAGIVGSITHCAGFRACAAARLESVITIGIDAEPNAALPDGVLEAVAHGPELELLDHPRPAPGGPDRVDLPRLLFSAKEAVYKAWFPLTGRMLGFDQVEVSLDVTDVTFTAKLLVPGPLVAGQRLAELTGHWVVEDGIIGTAVVVSAPAN